MKHKENFLEVKPFERREKYLQRCIPYLIENEGYERGQATAICNADYNRKK